MLELITNTLTFPGAVVHEYAHVVAVRRRGLRVLDVRLFKPFANPAGYVLHSPTRSRTDALVVGLAPFVVNTVFALAVGALALPAFELGLWAFVAVAWLSWSLALHAPPSLEDVGDVGGLASVALAPLKLLKLGEIVGTGYLFATIVTALGMLASVAVFDDVAEALEIVRKVAETLSILLG